MTEIRNRAEVRLIQALQRVVGLTRTTKFGLILLMDGILCVFAVWIAFMLRLGEWHLWTPAVIVTIAISLILWLPLFLIRGIYQSIVRFMGARTIANIATSCMIMAVALSLIFTFNPIQGIPRTIGVIHALIFATLLVLSRVVAGYALFDLLNRRRFEGQLSRVLIYGAGSAGRQLALSLRHEPGMALQGYIDDDPRLSGQRLDGVAIHASDEVGSLIARLEVDTVLLAIPRLSRQHRKAIVSKLENANVHVLTLPAMSDMIDGTVSVADLREIEIDDLLGRDAVPPNDLLLHRTITGRIVMVTGAGGSIGSELCRQIGTLNPTTIILVEMTEHALYSIEGELREAQRTGRIDSQIVVHAELGNVADAGTVRRMFDRWKPDTVFHAAAYKHVPLVEENVIAGMRNNIFGTLHCALEAERSGVQHFILISTDKAVRPTNVMGATKRTCELILQALRAHHGNTKFAMVRFGNVLGSSGSVVPRFQRQIRDGGPVTLTHRDVTRYFMTIPEAAQLVIQAGAMAEGGEVYVLDMGDPIRIYDLAKTMINLSGLLVRDETNPDGDIEIREIGLRKGEKLYEELLIGNSPRETIHPRIMRANEDFLEWPELSLELERLDAVLADGDRVQALILLSKLVPEFQGEQSMREA
ncbi:polysaccharide biosynthesis protein [Sphingomonas yabuuchiae]|uniref:FlaA1/EpsC-like NDP-sugar epimerase n=1 Tax=Sphingomonas yabuuchiae TaxID=172044 RepID=A0AA40ZWF7_9SPHN|nr:nucleoside-diphosphate sugar epimerase/dehydratase [Sphingomonas yabuuchiae]MBB4611411.1 FlaA1/EpsC-like NDP-sugar epimerase [Sphingomonas yabuuchiae]MBN3556997.1 polysaccharide biosynthesis protein [Sphingomonas yabuuchiae]